jgi:hypothetical protein
LGTWKKTWKKTGKWKKMIGKWLENDWKMAGEWKLGRWLQNVWNLGCSWIIIGWFGNNRVNQHSSRRWTLKRKT